MSNALRFRIIRLAYQRPELRRDLLPLLKSASVVYTTRPDPWPEEIPLPKPLKVRSFVDGDLIEVKTALEKNGEITQTYRFKTDSRLEVLGPDLITIAKLYGLKEVSVNFPGTLDFVFSPK